MDLQDHFAFSIDAEEDSKYLGRMINHTKKYQNLAPKEINVAPEGEPEDWRLYFVALVDIPKGQELAYNYLQTAIREKTTDLPNWMNKVCLWVFSDCEIVCLLYIYCVFKVRKLPIIDVDKAEAQDRGTAEEGREDQQMVRGGQVRYGFRGAAILLICGPSGDPCKM